MALHLYLITSSCGKNKLHHRCTSNSLRRKEVSTIDVEANCITISFQSMVSEGPSNMFDREQYKTRSLSFIDDLSKRFRIVDLATRMKGP